MRTSSRGSVRWRVFVIQILAVAGLFVSLELFLSHRARSLAERTAASREQKINVMFHDSVADEPTHEIFVPLNGVVVKRHPQRLRIELSPQGAEFTLGLPDTATTDFRGGQHLTWIGTTHKFEASFSGGRLYCVKLEDRATGRGVMVFESIWAWHPY